MTKNVVIIGAGLSGLMTADILMKNENVGTVRILERSASAGGISSSTKRDQVNYLFGTRILFINDQSFKEYIESYCPDLSSVYSDSIKMVYWEGRYIPYPVQYHLNKLPIYDRLVAFKDVIRTKLFYSKYISDNFKYTLINNFGKKIASIILSHTQKTWREDPKYIQKEYTFTKVAAVDLSKVLKGLFIDSSESSNEQVYYPKNGMDNIINSIVDKSKACNAKLSISCGTSVKSIDLSSKVVVTDKGEEIPYDTLINTIALPGFLRLVKNLPTEYELYRKLLDYNIMAVVVVATHKKFLKFKDKFMFYFSDNNTGFNKVTIPTMFGDSNQSVLVCEYSFPRHKRELLNDEQYRQSLIAKTIEELRQTLIDRYSDVSFTDFSIIDPGYVLYTSESGQAVNKIKSYLDDKLFLIGRYARWNQDRIEHTYNNIKLINDLI